MQLGDDKDDYFMKLAIDQAKSPRKMVVYLKGKAGLRFFMSKKIPKFKNENSERQFWSKHDSTNFIDWKKGKRIVPNKLKPSVKTISIRLPEMMIEELKLLANKKDVPYQSLLKVFLSERIEAELEHSSL